MLIGYARISTLDQNLDLQKDALANCGCEKIFTDVASGAKVERQGLAEALQYVREGDVLVVWRLDRLGRSLGHLIAITSDLNSKGIGFKSLQEQLDTTTSGGKLIFHLFGALAEFERELIRERTQAGLRAARARGRVGGRRPKMNTTKVAMAEKLLADQNVDVAEVCGLVGVSRATLYRWRKKSNVGNQPEQQAIAQL